MAGMDHIPYDLYQEQFTSGIARILHLDPLTTVIPTWQPKWPPKC